MKQITKLSFLLLLIGMITVSCKNDTKKAVAEETKTETTSQSTAMTGAKFGVDAANSKVVWVGKKPTGEHTGTLSMSSGDIYVKDGNITGGKFVIDMKSINVLDLEGEYKADLEAHLRGDNEGKEDHFFNVAKYPTGTFEVTKVVNKQGDEGITHMIYGNLTIKGITKPVGFNANVNITENAIHVVTPAFDINRTDWGINFMSKSVFDNLKDKFINDEISIAIDLTAKS